MSVPPVRKFSIFDGDIFKNVGILVGMIACDYILNILIQYITL